VAEEVGEGEPVGDPDCVGVEVGVAVGVADGEAVGEAVGDAVADGVLDGEVDGVELWAGALLPWAGPTRFGD
jgi:hypothetical protein